jgi:Domain of unknown function (DUF222)/HNH endonuclease
MVTVVATDERPTAQPNGAVEVAAPAAQAAALPRSFMRRGDRFLVVVHVDDETLRAEAKSGHAVLADGIRVSAETSRRVACDAARVRVTHDPRGNVLDVGRRSRGVPTPIRRALEHRDRACRFPGCTSRFCDAHHIVHWADGGATRLDNLVLLCRRHHRAVHEGGYSVELRADGEVLVRRPDGKPLPAAPPAAPLPENPSAHLTAQHRALGLDIDAETATSSWDGSPLDVDWAVLTLRPRPGNGAATTRRNSPVVPRPSTNVTARDARSAVGGGKRGS